jgi:tight adherence protein B
VTVLVATLLGAVAGLLLAPALVTVAELAGAGVPKMFGPIAGHASRVLDRALGPLRLAGAAGIAPTDKERFRLTVCAGAVGLVAGFSMGGKLAAAGAAIASSWVASHAFAWRRELYRRRLDAGAAGLALTLADALDAGQSVRGALAEGSRGLTGPIAAEFQRVAHELELGAETEATLERLRLRAGSRRLNLIVAAVLIQRQAGGSLASLLRDIAATIEEQDRLEDEARAASAQARFTSVVVLCLPLFGLALAELAAPGFIGRTTGSPVSTWLLGVALTLQISGLFLIRRLSRVDA